MTIVVSTRSSGDLSRLTTRVGLRPATTTPTSRLAVNPFASTITSHVPLNTDTRTTLLLAAATAREIRTSGSKERFVLMAIATRPSFTARPRASVARTKISSALLR